MSTPGTRRCGHPARAVGRTSRAMAIGLAFTAAAVVAPVLRPTVPTLAVLAAVLATGCLAWNALWVGIPLTTPSMLYFVALAVFHLGLVVPYAVDLAEPPAWLGSASEASLAAALACVLLAFSSLEIGLLVGWRALTRRPPAIRFTARRRRSASALYAGGVLACAVAAIAAALNARSIGLDRFLSSSYGYELYASTDSRLLQMGLFWLLPTGALIALAGARQGIQTARGLVLVGGAALLLLFAGDRGGAVSLGAAALVVWTGTRGSLPRRVVIAACAVVLILVPAIATLRQLPRNGVNFATAYEAARAASPLAALTEMGGSLRPLVETLRLVPTDASYRLGSSYLSAAGRLVPNLGLSRADADWRDPESLPPNHWITYAVAPWALASFEGLGFSAIAEPYLNFGIPGVLAYFLALGVVLGRLDLALARGQSRRRLALIAVVFMPLLLTVRNDFHNFVRPAVWGVGLVLLIEQVHGTQRQAQRAFPPARPAARVAGFAPPPGTDGLAPAVSAS